MSTVISDDPPGVYDLVGGKAGQPLTYKFFHIGSRSSWDEAVFQV